MSKRKPDTLIEYRFGLQDKERQMFDEYIHAHSFNSIASPIVSLMNDVTGMIVFLTIVAALGITGVTFTFLTAMLTTEATMAETIDQFVSQRDQAIAAGATVGIFGPASPITAQILNLFGLFPKDNNGGGGGGGF